MGNYIRIHLIPVLTYLTSSLQTSLQNQTKREGYEKDDFIEEWGKMGLMKKENNFTIPRGVGKYIGKWKKGKQHGRGTWTLPKGKKYMGRLNVVKGEWKNNKLVKVN